MVELEALRLAAVEAVTEHLVVLAAGVLLLVELIVQQLLLEVLVLPGKVTLVVGNQQTTILPEVEAVLVL